MVASVAVGLRNLGKDTGSLNFITVLNNFLMVLDEYMDITITDTPSNSQKINGNILGTKNSNRNMDA